MVLTCLINMRIIVWYTHMPLYNLVSKIYIEHIENIIILYIKHIKKDNANMFHFIKGIVKNTTLWAYIVHICLNVKCIVKLFWYAMLDVRANVDNLCLYNSWNILHVLSVALPRVG